MSKTPSILGVLSGISSIILWLVFCFFHPSSYLLGTETVTITFIMLALPASLAIFASFTAKSKFMFIAFLWSFPMSLYFAMAPSFIALFGATSFLYLVSFTLMLLTPRKSLVEQ